MDNWINTDELPSKNYTCGYCGKDISSNKGYIWSHRNSGMSIYICHHCGKPTFISQSQDKQVPGSVCGLEFDSKIFENDQDIFCLYNEARKCFSIEAYTSVGLCCRKLLMHIAVSCGAEENKKFIYYVDYLDKNNYIPKNAKKWVDIIRTKGNDANHEIYILNSEDAKNLICFTEMIINVVYKMEYDAKQYLNNS